MSNEDFHGQLGESVKQLSWQFKKQPGAAHDTASHAFQAWMTNYYVERTAIFTKVTELMKSIQNVSGRSG